MKQLAAGLGAIALLLSAREAAAACGGRPTDASGYAGYKYAPAEVKSYALSQVRVHYATSGAHAPDLATTRPDTVPATVALAADLAEDALTKYAQMGFRKIPSDTGCPSNGGDDKVDIYLVQFAGADGSTAAECNGGSCSSFALVESTFATKGYATAEEGFKTVVTHELFHAIQNVYREKHDAFWSEGTAQWAMKKLHPELQDFERQLPAFFNETSRSLDQPPSGPTAGFLYGSAVFPLFLSLKFEDSIIREIFEVEATGKDALPAIDEALTKKGSSLADAYPLFGAWNAGTGKTLPSTGGYPDAAKYPVIKVGKLEDGVAGITSGVAYFAYRGKLAAKVDVVLDSDAARNSAVVVPIEGGTLKLEQAKKLPATVEGEVVVVVAGVTTKKTDAKFSVRFQDPGTASSSSSGGDAGASSSGGGGGGGGDDCQAAPGPASPASGFALLWAAAALGLALRKPGVRRPDGRRA